MVSLMNRAVLLSLVGCLVVGACRAGETARGTVFHDADGNGRRDAGESGIEGVYVSNGTDVVKTDAGGQYELPVDNDTIVFVIKPRDWMTQIDELNVPRFYYIHKPGGSPDESFLYAGVEPTGPLPESIDFPLQPAPDPQRFTVILMGDPQPINRKQVHYYSNDVIAELIGTPARFGISMGDLVGDDLSLFGSVSRAQAVVGIPWYSVHGNHDQNYRAQEDKYADETFESAYGPPNYAFQYGKVHFIVLDNVYWKGYRVDEDGETERGNYEGRLTDRQLEFVRNYVATVPEDDRIVICTHIPLPRYPTAHRVHSTPEYRRLLEILSAHPYTMSFSAHMHTTQQFVSDADDGYAPEAGTEHLHVNVGTAAGSWFNGPLDEQGLPMTMMADGSPNGYVIATFDGHDCSLRYKAARMPDNYQMAIHAPAEVTADQLGNTEVLVNVFGGNEKTHVRMRVRSHGDWIDMQETQRTDPSYAALYRRDLAHPTPGQGVLPEPVQTPHLWVAKLPQGLQPGIYALEVETTDLFGQTDRAFHLIDVR